MPEQPPPFSGVPGQPDRRRPAATIDLKATEIGGDAGGGAEPPQPQSSEQPQSPPQQTQPPREEEAADSMGPEPRRAGAPSGALWRSLGAGIAGAVLTGAIMALVLPAIDRARGVALESRVAQLERQLADLAGSPRADPDLAARLQKLEAQVAAQGAAAGSPAGDPALAKRLAEIEAEVHSLRDMVEAASTRSEDTAAGVADARRRADANAAALAELARKSAGPSASASVDLAPRLAALADRVAALEGRPQSGDDRLARAALIAGALAGAVERGAPFAAELRAAQAEAADPKLLAPLEPFAASGLPSPSALADELSALEPQLLAAAGAASATFLQKLAANAEKLVRIRPIEEAQSGDEPAALIERAELKAAHDDLPGALAGLAMLPDSVRAPAQAWIAKAEARNAALEASRGFAARTLAALGKGAR